MSVTIRLTSSELAMAAVAGTARHAESIESGRKDAHGFDPVNSGLALHIEGACAEMAVAKWRGIYWGGHVGSFKGADLGAKVQVRVRTRHDYDLIVRDDDADDHAFIHVTGTAPVYVLRGWIYARDAKQPEWVQRHGNRPPAYFVPASFLRSIETRQGAVA